jgi:prophage antirepressor-like protein
MAKKKIATSNEINSKISTAITEKKENIDANEHTIGLKGKAIKFIIDVFTFVGIKFAYVIVGDVIYFRARDVAEFLGYINPAKAIRDLVNPKYRKTLGEILQGGSKLDPPCKINKNELSTIYITEAGLYQLIFGSKKKEADEFRQFVFEDILPNIRKNGSYSLNDDYIKDTTNIISFFDMYDISVFDNIPVVYIGVIGTHNGIFVYKFGLTSNIRQRLEDHKKNFGDQFKMLSVYSTKDNVNIEKQIKEYVKLNNLQYKITIGNAIQQEVFITNEISKIQVKIHQVLNNKDICAHNNDLLLIEIEKTKQEQAKQKQLEAQLEILKISHLSQVTLKQKVELKKPIIDEYSEFSKEYITKTDNKNDYIKFSTLKTDFEHWYHKNFHKIPPKMKEIKQYFEKKIFMSEEKQYMIDSKSNYKIRGWIGHKCVYDPDMDCDE